MRSPVYGLAASLRKVQGLRKKRLSAGGIVSNVGVRTTGRLGDIGNGFCVGQAEHIVIDNLERDQLEGALDDSKPRLDDNKGKISHILNGAIQSHRASS